MLVVSCVVMKRRSSHSSHSRERRGLVAAPLRCSSVRPSAVASPVLVLRFRGVLLVLAAVGAFIESAVEHDSYPVEDELGEQPGVVDANLATNRVFEHPRGLLDRPRSHLPPLQLRRPLGNSTHKGLDLVSDAVWAKREARHLAVVRREEPAD